MSEEVVKLTQNLNWQQIVSAVFPEMIALFHSFLRKMSAAYPVWIIVVFVILPGKHGLAGNKLLV